MTSLVMQSLGRPLEKTNSFPHISNATATCDGLIDALDAKATVKQVLTEAGWSEFEDLEGRSVQKGSQGSFGNHGSHS